MLGKWRNKTPNIQGSKELFVSKCNDIKMMQKESLIATAFIFFLRKESSLYDLLLACPLF